MVNRELELNTSRIKRATLNTTLQQPVAVYPTSMGVLAGVYLLAFGMAPIAAGLCVGGLTLGAGGWLYEYFVRGKNHALKIVNQYRKNLAKQRVAAIARIETELEKLHHREGQKQLQQLQAKYGNFESVLAKKLDVDELTYNRYLAMAEQVFLNALDNLEQLVFGLQSVSAINMATINEKLSRLEQDTEEYQTLLARAQLWHDQQQKAKSLLAENEQAMTQLDRVTVRLAEIRTREGHAVMDMDNAMAELEGLIQRASQYERR